MNEGDVAFYNLRDRIIPNEDVDEFDKIIHKHHEFFNYNHYNELLGTALYHYNLYIIASLNSLIREFNILTTKYKILESAYYAECRKNSSKFPDECISYMGFEDVKDKFYTKYARFI